VVGGKRGLGLQISPQDGYKKSGFERAGGRKKKATQIGQPNIPKSLKIKKITKG